MPYPFEDIFELNQTSPDRGIIRIPMEQDVPFTRRVRALVDTAEFQRLRQITQLGLASCVYPGATHTRFEHALGVFHNAIRYLWQLGKDSRFSESVSSHQVEVLLAAALLHDLGHWPFCHPIEDLSLPNLPSHEQFAASYLSENSELTAVLKAQWNIQPDEILDVLVAGAHSSAELRLIRSVLSGPIDIDKMDYLDRDSLHAGVPYGRNFDKNRLIQSLMVNEAGDGLAINSKGKTAAELMVFARYVMFSEVYWHHAVRSATCMFARAFFEHHETLIANEFFQLSEHSIIQHLQQLVADQQSADLIGGIFGPKRKLYKRAIEFSVYQHPEFYEQLAGKPYAWLVRCAESLAIRLSKATGQTLNQFQLLLDAPPPDREVEFRVDLYYPKEDLYRPLHEVSPVIEALAKHQFDDYVKRVRLFVHPACVDATADINVLRQELQAAIDEN